MNPAEMGRKGEAVAVDLLRRSGYRILGRNVKARFGEIDLVAREGETLCFVEIKSRSGLRFGWPEEAMTRQKRLRLSRLAGWYLQTRRVSAPVRFDVVSILFGPDGAPARTRLLKSAFELGDVS